MNERLPWLVAPTAEGRALAELLQAAGVAAEARDSFQYEMAKKYVVNGCANLLSCVTNCHCAGLLALHKPRMRTILREFLDVLPRAHPDAARPYPIEKSLAWPGFEEEVWLALGSYAEHYPSTWHDFQAGRVLEVHALNGYTCDKGRALGVPTPENDALCAEVMAACASARASSNANL